MRTLRYLAREKQERKSREVLEIFAPLAQRLGMNTIKWELEDLAFATLYPKRYDEIARVVSERAPRRDLFLQEVIEEVSADLRDAKIKARVTGRPKHYYSVYQKMIARNVGFDEIYDLVGIRVLVDTVRDCYAALGTIHARWNPIPGRFKDYIAMPKFNMYQSLHTTVIGPEGKHGGIGARVNGRLVALESALDNGETVEIFTSKAPDAGPSRDWLGFVKSARARNKIRHWFSKERREAAAENGKSAIARAIRKQGLPLQRLATGDALLAIATEMRFTDLSALYAAVGEGHVSA